MKAQNTLALLLLPFDQQGVQGVSCCQQLLGATVELHCSADSRQFTISVQKARH